MAKLNKSKANDPPGDGDSTPVSPATPARPTWLRTVATGTATALVGATVGGGIVYGLIFVNTMTDEPGIAVAERMSAVESLVATASERGSTNAVAIEHARSEIESLTGQVRDMEIVAAEGSATARAALEARLVTLEEKIAADARENEEAFTGIGLRFSQVAQDRSNDIAGQDSALRDIERTLAGIEARLAATETARRSDPAAAVALVRLSAALGRSMPFITELDVFETAAGETFSSDFRTAARAGAANHFDLVARFPEASRSALRALAASANSDAPLARAWNWLRGLVSIRPAGEIAGNHPVAIHSQATARLAEGNLVAALTALEGQPKEAAEAMASWLRDARRRIAIDAEFERHLNELLNTSG